MLFNTGVKNKKNNLEMTVSTFNVDPAATLDSHKYICPEKIIKF